MERQQHTAPEHYYEVPDGAPDRSDEDHPTAVLGTLLETGGSSFTVPPYEALPQHHQQYSYLDGSSSIASVGTSFSFDVESVPGPSAYQTTANWQQPGQDLLYANTAAYSYGMYNEAPAGDHTEMPAISHHGYVGSIDATIHMGYGVGWATSDAMGMVYEPTPFPSPTTYSSTGPLQLDTSMGTDSGTGASPSYASSRSGTYSPVMYSETTALYTPVTDGTEGEREEGRTSPLKRTRTKHKSSRSEKSSFSSSSATASSDTSGSSSSATTARPHERKEERKTRGSHNLVEKQYRNRLNAQFEGLMNALPEGLKLQGGVESSEADRGVVPDAPERKPSKAEVLEMARIHIRALEQERDGLVQERKGLLGDITRLEGELASRSAGTDNAGRFWTGKEQP